MNLSRHYQKQFIKKIIKNNPNINKKKTSENVQKIINVQQIQDHTDFMEYTAIQPNNYTLWNDLQIGKMTAAVLFDISRTGYQQNS